MSQQYIITQEDVDSILNSILGKYRAASATNPTNPVPGQRIPTDIAGIPAGGGSEPQIINHYYNYTVKLQDESGTLTEGHIDQTLTETMPTVKILSEAGWAAASKTEGLYFIWSD